MFLPPTAFLLCLIGALVLHYTVPIVLLIGWPINLTGLLFAGLGIFLLLSGNNSFARAQTNINTFRPPDTLVTGGVFRFTRNPMYLGFLFVLLGASILLGSLSPLLTVALFFLLANFWYIPFEERTCEQKLGAEYLAYKKKTRRWI